MRDDIIDTELDTDLDTEIAIVGGGPAGLSAALALARARRAVTVIDGGRPRNRFASHMHGVLGHDGLPPTELLRLGRAEVEGYGGRFISGDVTEASLEGDTILVGTPAGTVRARRLLVATGIRDELPAIEGLREQWGWGVVVCPYCDGWERRNGVIGVIATSPVSVEQAQLLRQWSDRIVYFTNGVGEPDTETERRMLARSIRIERRGIRRIVTDAADTLTGVELDDATVAELGAIFTGPTMVPRDDLLRALGAATTVAHGSVWVEVDADGRTSVPGVWAAGNVVDPRANVPVSLGAGALIAGAINADLVRDDVEAAVSAAGVGR
ncbi:NAD(P)/FAD-dependent oxidoreductase [Leifsonia sp. NPDC058248]|uniref:NAD(P)/FAD-dependent oxidoreductase n=1 Tax=Leifsonia sp. NPDC058248 TaxID=3346402 RepID=UPI0036DB1A79